jgi:predicted lipoprotein with Yx(FWY)xxD motif
MPSRLAPRALAPLLAAGAMLAAAGWSAAQADRAYGGPPASSPATPASGAPALAARATAPAAAPTVRVRPSRFGRILTDGRGFTLYVFTRDGRGPSRCEGACAVAWPPLIARGAPRAGAGASARLLGTTRRSDGTRQVTWGGRPVYLYVGETRAGQILCQDVDEYGGTWLLTSPAGRPIR